MDRQTLRDWVHRFNAGGLAGLADRPRQNGPKVWNSHNAIVDACCLAWNKLRNMPQRLASITHRTWARAVSG